MQRKENNMNDVFTLNTETNTFSDVSLATARAQSQEAWSLGKSSSVPDTITKWKEDLIKDIRFFDHRDDLDGNDGSFPEVPSRPITVYHPTKNITQTMSVCNMESIKSTFGRIKSKAKCILEIGVDCNGTPTEMTATRALLDNKDDSTFYFGIDLDDKTYLDDEKKNIYTFRTNSSNIQDVMNFIRSKGITEIDYLFIDGWHSINQVLIEWEYTRWLSDIGIVGFHDTSVHPGPAMFLKYLNTEKWNVVENSCNYDQDFGTGFAWKK